MQCRARLHTSVANGEVIDVFGEHNHPPQGTLKAEDDATSVDVLKVFGQHNHLPLKLENNDQPIKNVSIVPSAVLTTGPKYKEYRLLLNQCWVGACCNGLPKSVILVTRRFCSVVVKLEGCCYSLEVIDEAVAVRTAYASQGLRLPS